MQFAEIPVTPDPDWPGSPPKPSDTPPTSPAHAPVDDPSPDATPPAPVHEPPSLRPTGIGTQA